MIKKQSLGSKAKKGGAEMFIKNLFVFILLIWFSKVTLATGGSYEQNSVKDLLPGAWEFVEIIPENVAIYLADHRQNIILSKEPYPDSVVVRPIGYIEPYKGQVEIKLPDESAPLIYEFSEHGPIWTITLVTYDKMPEKDPYKLLIESVVYFEGDNSLVIKLRSEKQDVDGNEEHVKFMSYTFMVEGDTLLLTRTNTDNLSIEHTQNVSYTRQKIR